MNQERLTRLLLIVAGYALAVAVASSICVIVLFSTDIFQVAGRTGPPDLQTFFSVLFIVGLPATALSAWPGFLLTVAAIRVTGYSNTLYFTVCGIATAFLSVFVAAETFWGGGVYALLTAPALYAGGAAGGLAYALFDRRFLTGRRT